MNVISPMNIKEADPQFVTYNEYAYGVGRYEVFDGRKVSPGSGWNSAFHPSTGNCYQQQSFNQGIVSFSISFCNTIVNNVN